MYEEIEALGLTPVTQRENDRLPAGLNLGNLTPVPLSPCSLPLTAFLGEHPAEGSPPPEAMAAKSSTKPAPIITGSPLPTPLTLESVQEAPPLSCLPPEAQSLASVRQSLVLAEVTRVGDLLDYDRGDWLDPLTFTGRMGLSRPRTPRRVLQEVKAALMPAARTYLNRALREGAPRPPSTPGLPDLSIGPLPRISQQTSRPFIASRLHELQPVSFQIVPWKYLYTLTLHTLQAHTLVSRPDTKWRDLLPPLEGEQPRWASLYSTLVPRPVGDISWRLLHGAVSMGRVFDTVHPHPRYLPFLQYEGNPGTRMFRVCQAAAPFPAPHEYFITLLATLFPSPFYLHTPHPWPHKIARSPG
ncbi:unnamed protein product [Lepidochelys olivacea]